MSFLRSGIRLSSSPISSTRVFSLATRLIIGNDRGAGPDHKAGDRMATLATSSSGDADTILAQECNGLGVAILNRPKALNSLDTYMVTKLLEQYEKWRKDTSIQAMLIKGNGRAFCAGGDVRSVYKAGKDGDVAHARDFFGQEYALNHLIGALNKPHVALLDGVVMGGGNGISMHGSFRIATENTLFAMPETAIGLHPDVGASFFLSRLPSHLGEFLAVTGTRLNGAELLKLGLATHYVPAKHLDALENRIVQLSSKTNSSIAAAIAELAEPCELPAGSILFRKDLINAWFSKASMEEILSEGRRLAQVSSGADSAWIEETMKTIQRMSPTAMKVSLRSIREGRSQTLAQCLRREYRLSARAMEKATSHDFYEGVRALLVDKDNAPKWSPPRVEDVSADMVEKHFAPFANESEEIRFPDAETAAPWTASKL